MAVADDRGIYLADVMAGQKTGLFYDQRPNHAFAASSAKGARVLDVFSLWADSAGCACGRRPAALSALPVPQRPCPWPEGGAQAMGLADRLVTRRGDAFAVMEALRARQRNSELVICDPPAFAPSKQALEAGLRAMSWFAKLAAPLVAPGGTLILCSCSHAADLRASCGFSPGIGRLAAGVAHSVHRVCRADHPVLPQLPKAAI